MRSDAARRAHDMPCSMAIIACLAAPFVPPGNPPIPVRPKPSKAGMTCLTRALYWQQESACRMMQCATRGF